MEGHGEGHGETGHDSGEHDNDPDTHMGSDDESRLIALARAAAEAGLSSSAAQALGITSANADAHHGLENINHNIDPGTFRESSIVLMRLKGFELRTVPPTDPSGGLGAGGASSSGDGGSTPVDVALNTYMQDFITELDKRIPGDGSKRSLICPTFLQLTHFHSRRH